MHSWERDLDRVQRALLEQPVRRRIANLLDERPGLNLSRVARELGIHLNLARFHLRKLADAGVVELRPGARKREVLCFLQRDARLGDEPRTRLLFGGSPAGAVARHVALNPGATARQVADATGLTFGAAHYHLAKLMERRLVARIRGGSEYQHYPRGALARWASPDEP